MGKEFGLNVIVGPGESQELDRLLTSVIRPGIFDEVVVVRTAREPALEAVATKHGAVSPYFQWTDHFADARNMALDNSTARYVMWLDADDTISARAAGNLSRMRDVVVRGEMDVYLLPYHLAFDKSGAVTEYIMRDRIFRRLSSLRWHKACHEQLSVDPRLHKTGRILGIPIEHHPTKPSGVGMARNVRILTREYKRDPTDPHTIFYLGRDLFQIGKTRRAVPLLDGFVQNHMGPGINLFAAAMLLAKYYTYKDAERLRADKLPLGENYARIAMSFSEKYAEPYLLLGDIAYHRGHKADAERFFSLAMTKHAGDGDGLRSVHCYETYPADRLALMCAEAGDLERALYYNWRALKNMPEEKRLLGRARHLLGQLMTKYGASGT